MIIFDNVCKKYGKQPVLKKVNFEVKAGEFVVLIGPSGCGKTTTLKMINRLIESDSGRITIGGKDISALEKVALRRNIGYVIQQVGLFPNMTIEQNISVVPKLLKVDGNEIKKKVKELMAMVNMDYDEYARKYPSQLSGGQQQRVGVLRALAASPDIVLMDEPFGALDPLTREVLQSEVSKIQKQLNKTIIMVTHDMEEALNLADRIIFMEEGHIVQIDTPEGMLKNPATPMVRSFLGKHMERGNPMTAADAMKTRIYKVMRSASIERAMNIMGKQDIDTVIVTEKNGEYIGIIRIEDIPEDTEGKALDQFLSTDLPVVSVDDDAKDALNKLLLSKKDYIVVLATGKQVAGIITKSGISRVMAERLWGMSK